jgi:hypothetical protein
MRRPRVSLGFIALLFSASVVARAEPPVPAAEALPFLASCPAPELGAPAGIPRSVIRPPVQCSIFCTDNTEHAFTCHDALIPCCSAAREVCVAPAEFDSGECTNGTSTIDC